MKKKIVHRPDSFPESETGPQLPKQPDFPLTDSSFEHMIGQNLRVSSSTSASGTEPQELEESNYIPKWPVGKGIRKRRNTIGVRREQEIQEKKHVSEQNIQEKRSIKISSNRNLNQTDSTLRSQPRFGKNPARPNPTPAVGKNSISSEREQEIQGKKPVSISKPTGSTKEQEIQSKKPVFMSKPTGSRKKQEIQGNKPVFTRIPTGSRKEQEIQGNKPVFTWKPTGSRKEQKIQSKKPVFMSNPTGSRKEQEIQSKKPVFMSKPTGSRKKEESQGKKPVFTSKPTGSRKEQEMQGKKPVFMSKPTGNGGGHPATKRTIDGGGCTNDTFGTGVKMKILMKRWESDQDAVNTSKDGFDNKNTDSIVPSDGPSMSKKLHKERKDSSVHKRETPTEHQYKSKSPGKGFATSQDIPDQRCGKSLKNFPIDLNDLPPMEDEDE